MAIPLTRELGRFIAGIRYDQLPAPSIAVAKLGFTDCIAVMIAGSAEPVATIARDVLAAKGANQGEARLLPSGDQVSALDAALINGAAGHAFDYDDVALDGHPSAVLVPAILAEAEALGASGQDMITAYVAGYEVWAELLARQLDRLHAKGWHPTCVFGAVAAAAACAALRKLDAEKAATALAIAASEASGVVANFGTMMKPLQVGRSAQSGVVAARLAAAGLTASLDALEHASGYLAVFSPKGAVDIDSPVPLGKTWRSVEQGLNVKQYPMCYCTHRVVDGVVDLATVHDIDPAQVERVDVLIGDVALKMLRNHRPVTGLEAKFSIEFAVASGLTARRAGLGELTDPFVNRADIQALIGKVHCETVTDTIPGVPFAPFDQVTVTLAGGKTVKSPPMRYARGSIEAPLSVAELRGKFDDCVAGKLTSADGAALFTALDNLERLASARELKMHSATAPKRAAS